MGDGVPMKDKQKSTTVIAMIPQSSYDGAMVIHPDTKCMVRECDLPANAREAREEEEASEETE